MGNGYFWSRYFPSKLQESAGGTPAALSHWTQPTALALDEQREESMSVNPTADPALVPSPGMPADAAGKGRRGKRRALTFMDSDDVGVVEGGHDLNLSPDMDKVLLILDFVFPD